MGMKFRIFFSILPFLLCNGTAENKKGSAYIQVFIVYEKRPMKSYKKDQEKACTNNTQKVFRKFITYRNKNVKIMLLERKNWVSGMNECSRECSGDGIDFILHVCILQ